jgi:hypothetical protein
LSQINHLNERRWGAARQREAAPALNLSACQRLNCWGGAQEQRCGASKACQFTRRISRMQSRCAIRFVGTLMLFVHNNEANLVTQRTERNACADNEVRSWLKETVVCIEPLAGTQA